MQNAPFLAYAKGPIINDPDLEVKLVTRGLRFPTTMDFLAAGDILVLEKDNGTVRRILNGQILGDSVLDLNVANKFDRGMIGIAISRNQEKSDTHDNIRVFTYLTESERDGSDKCTSWSFCERGNEPEGNRLYRHQWNGKDLVNARLLLNLPANAGPAHNGGFILIGPDNNVYVVVGDVRSPENQVQNVQNESVANGASGILRIDQNGGAVGKGILSNEHPLNFYYAYGIRNSFGMDFDPVTGKLWDTENGYLFGDEINLVEPGFNSGWIKVQGIWNITTLDDNGKDAKYPGQVALNPDNLVEFDGKGKYSNPELTWKRSVGLTSLKFYNSDKLGKEYKNDIFVGDFTYGKIYHFELEDKRTELDLKGSLADKVVDEPEEVEDLTFGKGFGSITDIKIGPDGCLYVLSFYDGAIYKVCRKNLST
jgi:glucose/arabinose dehydrogenase